MTEKTPPGFMTYRECALIFTFLPDEDAAAAMKAACNYFLFKKRPDGLSEAAAHVADILCADIDKNAEKYAKICKRNAENIGRRWSKDAVPLVYDPYTSGVQTQTETETKIVNGNLNQSASQTYAGAPAREEVQDFFKSQALNGEASAFYDHYAARGWILSGELVADWQALARSWSRKEATFGMAPSNPTDGDKNAWMDAYTD